MPKKGEIWNKKQIVTGHQEWWWFCDSVPCTQKSYSSRTQAISFLSIPLPERHTIDIGMEIYKQILKKHLDCHSVGLSAAKTCQAFPAGVCGSGMDLPRAHQRWLQLSNPCRELPSHMFGMWPDHLVAGSGYQPPILSRVFVFWPPKGFFMKMWPSEEKILPWGGPVIETPPKPWQCGTISYSCSISLK